VAGRSVLAGLVAGGGLIALYLGVISLAQGPVHALAQLLADAPFVVAVSAGFGIQVGLFIELRTVARRHRASAAVTAAGTTTSTAAMLACCAHHLADLAPLIGLSGAVIFLDGYKIPLLVLGLAMNAAGIAVAARELRRARRG
jgi:hypothetical protein